MMTREYWLSKGFQDRSSYPYGLSRSGDFTIRQSQLLEDNGTFIQALLNDQVVNPTKDDLLIRELICSGSDSDDELVNAWLKYSRIKAKGKSMASFNDGGKKRSVSEVEVDDDWDSAEVLEID